RQTLRTELDVGPAVETTALYEQIRADEFGAYTVDAPPAINTPSHHNLPASTTPLIGRAAEISQLLQLLADPRRRLVSIVAPGGMGKSHLAIAVATELVPHYADGVYFVALAPLTDAETIVPAIAAGVGYTFQNDGRALAAQLLDYLRAKELLLLLDNAEHLPTGVSLFTAILEAAPNVRLLVTSRERLRLNSETVFTLEGLAISEGDNQAQGAAVALFIQTAQRVRPTFEPTAADWPAIQQICRLVGGMPLGLILAASWVELLSLAEIAAEISRSLDFLAADLRDIPERHHSLRAVFESTWQRLSAEEQRVFQKLGVFRGGFTREAAERVADAALATLTVLKHKALIQTQPNGRFEIHELLRQYALEMLRDQRVDVRDKHSAYYCDFLAQRDGDLKGARQQAAMAEIEAESENIRMAWQWAVRRNQFDQLIDGIDSLGLFYLWRSRLHEGEEIFRQAVEQLKMASPTAQTVPIPSTWIRFTIRALLWLSTFQRHLRQSQSAEDSLRQARQWMA
ncbi:MAG: AAA family ATPase, partial [Caldilineaceae bacterium]|nr:AAA family ATPase [Caldilineaceae bacterium]